MKLEVGRKRPDNFKPLYPEEFELFSHLELVSRHTSGAVCRDYLERKRKAEYMLPLVELFPRR